MRERKFAAVLAAVFAIAGLLSSEASATVLTSIASDPADQVVHGNGTLRFVGQNPNRVGPESATRDGNALVLVFELPTLPAGESISEADLQVNVVSKNGPFGGDPDYNVDVYGVRADNSSAVLLSDFFMDANDGSATKVQENYLNWLTTPAGVHNTTDDAAVGAWLSTLYTGDTPNSTYAFVRLNADVPAASLPANRYFTINSGNSNSSTDRPLLTITTVAVPEPASLVLVGLGSLLMSVRRQSR